MYRAIENVIKNSNLQNLTLLALLNKLRNDYQHYILYATALAAIKSAKKKHGTILDNSHGFMPSIVTQSTGNDDYASYIQDSEMKFKRWFICGKPPFFINLENSFTSMEIFWQTLTKLTADFGFEDACDSLVLLGFLILESENA